MKTRSYSIFRSHLVMSCAVVAMSSAALAAPSSGVLLSGTNTLNANNAVINGDGRTGYFVENGILTISNATLTNFATQGGTGSGGGAGLGGAIFVNSGATVTLNNVNLLANSSQGGSADFTVKLGGTLNNLFSGSAASTGNAGGDASAAFAYLDDGKGRGGYTGTSGGDASNGFGGTGGRGGDGSNGDLLTLDLAQSVYDIGKAAYETASGSATSAVYTAIAAQFSAQGAVALAGIDPIGPGTVALGPIFISLAAQFTTLAADSAGDTSQAVLDTLWETSKNAAIMTTKYQLGVSGIGGDGGTAGSGGAGSYGFGGGAGGAGGKAGDAVSLSGALGGAGGEGGGGGLGGFGAGGGGGGNAGSPGSNGGQAQTAIAYGSPGSGGSGGFGGGTGADGEGGAGGNGGDGMGGAIFVSSGGTLNITGSALFDGNTARGGSGQTEDDSIGRGSAGSSSGSNIFMMKGSTVNLDAGEGNVIQFKSDPYGSSISDDSIVTTGGTPIASGQGASLHVKSGLTIFEGTNLYSGNTYLDGGVLQAQDSEGIYFDSNITFNGGVLQSHGEFTRYVGAQSSRTQWTGDGGFAARDGDLVVRLGNGQGVKWGAYSFVPNGNKLIFGSTSADSQVFFINNIDLGAGNRNIVVKANNSIAETETAAAIDANVDHTTLRGVLSNGSLTVGGMGYSGRLNLAAANTYAGGTTINGGTLALVKAFNPITGTLLSTGSFNGSGAMVVNEGGNLDISQTGNQSVGTLAGAGTVSLGGNALTLNQNADTTFSGSIQNGGIGGGTNGSIDKTGSGTLTLSGANTYTGYTNIDAGRLTLSGSLNSASVMVATGATLDVTTGGLRADSSLTNAGTINLTSNDTVSSFVSNSGTLNTTGYTLTAATYALNSGTVINANLGTGTVTNNGSVNLNGTSNAGVFKIQSGTTTLGSAERLRDNVDLAISLGANLILGGNEKIGTLDGAGNLNNNGGRLTLDDGTFSGVVSGAGGLTKVSDGSLVLMGASTYTGSTLVNLGTLELSGSGRLVSNSITIAAPATLSSLNAGLASAATVNNAGILNIGDVNDTITTLNNTGTVNGSATLTASTYNFEGGSVVNANLGTGILNVSNGLTLLNGTSDAGTLNIASNGTLSLATAERLIDSVTVNVDGQLNLLGGDETIYSLNGSGKVDTGSYKLIITNGGLFTGDLKTTSLGSNGGALGIASGGTVNTGGLTVNNGSSTSVTNGSTIDSSDDVIVKSGGLLEVQTGGVVTSDTITVDANGTLSLGSSYTLNYGLLNGSGTVNTNGNRFNNNGLVKGFLTFTNDFRNNGTLAAGNSPGLVTINGNYNEFGQVQAEVQTTIPVTGHDQIRVGGTITIDPSATLIVQTFQGAVPQRGNVYQIYSDLAGSAKTVNGNFGSVLFDFDGTAGSGAAVNNAAVVFDQATGRVISTGLNGPKSTFADLGQNNNQRGAASAIFTVAQGLVGDNQINTSVTGSPGFFANQIIDKTNTPHIDLAKYTPDYYGAIADYSFAGDRALAQQVQDRLSVASNRIGSTTRGAGFGGMIDTTADTGDNATVDRQDYFAGADFLATPKFQAGLMLSKNEGDISASYGRSSVDGFGGLLYAHTELPAKFSAFGTLGYSESDHDLQRQTVNGVAIGSTEADAFTGSLGVQHQGWTYGKLSVSPRVTIICAQSSVDGFTETGVIDALTNGGYDSTQVSARAGASVEWSTPLAGRTFNVEFKLGIEQVLVDDNDRLDVNVVSQPSIAYPVGFADDAATRMSYGLNLAYDLNSVTTVYTGIGGIMSSEASNNVNVGIRVGF